MIGAKLNSIHECRHSPDPSRDTLHFTYLRLFTFDEGISVYIYIEGNQFTSKTSTITLLQRARSYEGFGE